ncbi:hypothetical protein [Nocardia salmonicida]|uniref:hypothetical protein n=1 Tax=Nocardia salmonicida TaxID=53431 RepID=UPI0037B9F64F
MTQPQRRSTPSVLDSADPCAVRTRIDTTVESGAQEPYRCLFTYRGERVQVRYGTGIDESAPRTDIAGWPVFYREYATGDRAVDAVAMVDGVRIDRPAVTVRGTNREVVDEVIRLVLETLPPR